MRRLSLLLIIILNLATFTAQADDAPAAKTFTLNTNAFLDEGTLPVLYTCDGKDVSPEFDWTNVPAKTQTFALILVDPTAPGGDFYHWVVYNLPKTTSKLLEGDKLPAGAMAGKNGWNKAQYNGPCPPKGSAHTYIFTLYALDSKLDVPAGADGKTVVSAMQKHILGKVSLTTVFSRWLQ
ncbi:MAG TPA: YbhB/YbcL family Raf kinase inhibitor-like protein [Gammaproteobacteria bacterium]|jgi:hypothetical protein|nr:YbhB/YbcL family Raf kinase inhibitor-like protein [Gammaproteobacteria bacterium]